MAHSEHNRPKGSGVILIAIGVLIFFFVPQYYTKDLIGGMALIIFGFAIGGLGFYFAFVKKRA
ncbi:MAG: hypothetical protein KGI02_05390 [Thaumarchaeota archaeon]|nr:hypothetical protein [Nitrososphaerota archaeon]MDE1840346.1 hypothetical protein [Nitrososphaerota archaeon]MDE1878093.1 hypothetical protein [Nitrososphaerota archaeon]